MEQQHGLATEEQMEDPFADMRSAKPWLQMLKDSEKVMANWHERCDNIEKLYADLERLANSNVDRKMQMFWANMEVLKPSIYSRPPVPVVTARFKDRKPLVRHASELLERSLITAFEIDDIHDCMKQVRDDLALYGQGVPWVVLKGNDNNFRLCFETVNRVDYRQGVARTYREVPWKAKRTYNNRQEMMERFIDAQDVVMKATFKERGLGADEDNENQGDKKAEVWELWHKEKGVVVWVTPDTEEVLDIQEPFLSLDNFFPCPRPAYATLQPGTLIPVPDFLFIRDQLEEINELTARISALAEALRMKGFYSAGNEDVGDAVEQALKATDDNAMLIPVPNVAALGGAGMDKAIIWLPVEQVAATISQLVLLRKQVIEDVYQISGISDIMRGETDANETLGAQQLKSNYGSVRIRDKQEELIRVARDLTRIAAEIMAENFTLEQLSAMSQYDEVPSQAQIDEQVMQLRSRVMEAANDPQMVAQAEANPEQAQQIIGQVQQRMQQLESQITFEQVVEFLRNERLRPFVLEIETDSTIQPDENAQKQRTTEFLTALSTALSQLAPMVAQQPQSAEFAGEVLKFAVAPFRAGRELETAIDTFTDQMKQMAAQPQTDPEAERAQMEMQTKQADMQLKQADMQVRMQEMQSKAATEAEQAQADLAKTSAEIQKIYAEIAKIAAEPVREVAA